MIGVAPARELAGSVLRDRVRRRAGDGAIASRDVVDAGADHADVGDAIAVGVGNAGDAVELEGMRRPGEALDAAVRAKDDERVVERVAVPRGVREAVERQTAESDAPSRFPGTGAAPPSVARSA